MNPPPSHESLLQLLQEHWGYESFRPLQQEIITSVLRGEHSVGILPTGSGKSLCYQLPALAQRGCAIVISPLIALMNDQVAALSARGIPAIALHGGMSPAALQGAMADISDGVFKLVYCSPERLQTKAFQNLLRGLPLSLIAVDEAHCISQWGHDFRPEYLDIAWLGKLFSNTPVLALTATATPEVLREIVAGLALNAPNIFRQSFERANIFYEVKRSERKSPDMIEALRGCGGAAIIYCRSRAATENAARTLRDAGITAAHYHAGMKSEDRGAAQDEWMEGRVQAIAATTAFGMGIDKADVRLVLHEEPPEDLESWYQESGRAGRDGLQSRSVVLFDEADLRRMKSSTKQQYPPEAYLRTVYQAVAEYLQIPVSAQPDRYYPFDIADFCKKFSLKPAAVLPAMRLLAREGLWTMTDAVLGPPPARFTTSRERLDDFVERNLAAGMLATALLRLYAGIFKHPVPVHLGRVARKLKWPVEQVAAGMRELVRMGIIAWEPAPEGPRLFFHHYRVESKNLLLNTTRLEMLRTRHEARIEAMSNFVADDVSCRDTTVLRYFGESRNSDCGHCDVCIRKAAGVPDGRSVRTLIIDALGLAAGPVSLAALSSLLPGHAQPALIEELRNMVSAGAVEWHTDNSFSLVPKSPRRRRSAS